jgi:4-alpha-glucanotransferase
MHRIDPSSLLHSPSAKQWKQIGIKKHHGIDLPLFSLHSEQSHGIGEFPDLFPLINWCDTCGLDVIQLLPLNDTGLDTSPYSALSAFALNPIHIGLNALPHLERYPLLQDELKAVPKQPHSSRINYAFVRESKERFLRQYYQATKSLIVPSESYQDFIKQSAHWLKGYALFKALKVHYKWAGWEQWPSELQNPTPAQINALFEEHQEEIQWHSFLQYLCDVQMGQVKKYAALKSIYLMGDIPILISRDSADVWLHRHLFDLNYSAGAPPDMYSADGQNWGFPIYNWEAIEAERYKWWIDRLQLAAHYYQIYRIDHIVGFFRIWSIPPGMTGKDGHYIPTDPALWIDHGQKIMLMMLQNCSMLPIGEDLGNVPPTVRECLTALGICGTKLMRWEREWEIDRSFTPLDTYLPTTMTTVSTHDSETLQLWWQNNPAEAKDFAAFKGWTYQPVLSREYHREILWDSHHSGSLFHINPLQEYLALIPGLTWPTLEEERINIPGVYSDQNWGYRFRPTVEEIVNNQTLTHMLKEMIF